MNTLNADVLESVKQAYPISYQANEALEVVRKIENYIILPLKNVFNEQTFTYEYDFSDRDLNTIDVVIHCKNYTIKDLIFEYIEEYLLEQTDWLSSKDLTIRTGIYHECRIDP